MSVGSSTFKASASCQRRDNALLMPRPWFVRDVRAIGEADVTHIQRLADDYNVSLEACANRYVELTDDRPMEGQRHDLRRAGRGQSGSDDHRRCGNESSGENCIPASYAQSIRTRHSTTRNLPTGCRAIRSSRPTSINGSTCSSFRASIRRSWPDGCLDPFHRDCHIAMGRARSVGGSGFFTAFRRVSIATARSSRCVWAEVR